MQFNASAAGPVFTLKSLSVPPSSVYPVLTLAVTGYILMLVFNTTLLLTIALNRQLHKPMFLLLLNLPINDIMGTTAFYPHLIRSILLQDRTISYPVCFLQGFLVHMYGGGALLTLTAMAYDRYVAICSPLRYTAIMSHAKVAQMLGAVWFVNGVLIVALFALLAHCTFCHSILTDIICVNNALTRAVCEDTRVNNYYGLFITAFLQSVTLLTVIFTYVQILVACLRNRHSDTKNKAVRTCATHLTVFLLFEVNMLFTVISYRFSEVSPMLQQAIGISIIVFPPILNPLIYGLNTSDIRSKGVRFLSRMLFPDPKTFPVKNCQTSQISSVCV